MQFQCFTQQIKYNSPELKEAEASKTCSKHFTRDDTPLLNAEFYRHCP